MRNNKLLPKHVKLLKALKVSLLKKKRFTKKRLIHKNDS